VSLGSKAGPEVRPTRMNTHVIIDGVRQRVTKDVVSGSRQQTGTRAASTQAKTDAQSATYSGGTFSLYCMH